MHIVSQFDRWFYLFILNKKNNFSTYVLKILNKHNKVSLIDIKKFFLSDLIGRFLRFDIPSRSYTILHISVTSFVRDRIVKHIVSELKGPESPCDRSEHIYIERKKIPVTNLLQGETSYFHPLERSSLTIFFILKMKLHNYLSFRFSIHDFVLLSYLSSDRIFYLFQDENSTIFVLESFVLEAFVLENGIRIYIEFEQSV